MVDAATLAGMRARVHALLTEPDGRVEANCGHVASRWVPLDPSGATLWEFCAPCFEILSGQAEFAQEEEEDGVDDTADDAV
jgi:hypothetical protein